MRDDSGVLLWSTNVMTSVDMEGEKGEGLKMGCKVKGEPKKVGRDGAPFYQFGRTGGMGSS